MLYLLYLLLASHYRVMRITMRGWGLIELVRLVLSSSLTQTPSPATTGEGQTTHHTHPLDQNFCTTL